MSRGDASSLARRGKKDQTEGKSTDDYSVVQLGKFPHTTRPSPLLEGQQEKQESKQGPKHQRGQDVVSIPMAQEGSTAVSSRGWTSSTAKKIPLRWEKNEGKSVQHTVAPFSASVGSKLPSTSCIGAENSLFTYAPGGYLNSSSTSFGPLTERCTSHEEETATNTEACDKSEGGVNTSTDFGEFLTDDILREWTGWEDLHLVLTAEMHLDAVRTLGVDTLSQRMPLLHSLRLNNSRIPQIRLLGTKFMNLRRLWVRGSRIQCLRGIGVCAPALEELYASFNFIRDITPLLDLSDTLEVVDLEGNEISDSNTLLQCLPQLRKLKYFTLQGNPVEMSYYASTGSSTTPEKGFSALPSFREFVYSIVPWLQYLDDIPLTENNSRSYSSATTTALMRPMTQANHSGQQKQETYLVDVTNCVNNHVDPLDISLCDEYMFLQQCIRECGFDALDAAVEDETRSLYTRPQTSCAGARPRRSTLPLRLNSAEGSGRSVSSAGRRPPVYSNSTHTPPSKFSPNIKGGNGAVSTSVMSPFVSSLTMGQPMMGGGALSLRRRQPLSQPLSSPDTIDRGGGVGSRSSSKKSDGAQSAGHETQHRRCNSGVLLTATERDDDAVVEQDELQYARTYTPECTNHFSVDAPLFDEEEDEWELYKRRLLRQVDSQNTSAQRWIRYVGGGCANSLQGESENVGSSHCSYSTSTSSVPTTLGTIHGVKTGQAAPSHSLPQSSFSTQITTTPPSTTAAVAVAVATADSFESCAANAEVSPDDRPRTAGDTGEKGIREKMNDDERREEEAWRQELLRSVARSRTRTARAATGGKSLRLGDTCSSGPAGYELLENGEVEFGVHKR